MCFLPFPIAGVGEEFASASTAGFLGTPRRMPHCDLLPWETRQFGIPIGGIGDGTRIGGAATFSPEDPPETT